MAFRSEWTIDGEDILLQCAAVYNKMQGTIFVTNKRMAWYQSTAHAPQLSVPLSFLKGAPKRNKSEELFLLKFVPQEEVKGQSEFTFVFGSAAERDGLLEVVSQLLQNGTGSSSAAEHHPAPAPAAVKPGRFEGKAAKTIREAGVASAEARRRATALAGDVELRQVYKELVESKILGEEEFWEMRKGELDRQNTKSKERGLPSELVSDVRPSLVRPGEVHYRLTADAIRQIFSETPAVRRAYEDNVPHLRSEQDFWKEYLQSRYVAGSRTQQVTVGDIFAEAEAHLEEEEQQERKQVDVLASRMELDFDLREGEGEIEGLGPEDANEPVSLGQEAALTAQIAAKFNAHGAKVLEQTAAWQPESAEITDLVRKEKEDRAHILMLKQKKEQEEEEGDDGGLRPMDQEEDDQENAVPSVEERNAFMERLKQQQLPDEGDWEKTKWKEKHEDEAAREELSAVLKISVTHCPPETLQLWNRTHELLRHYWSCFPLTTAKGVAKARNMRDALQKLTLTQEPLKSSLRPAVVRALEHSAAIP
jgi:transcription initiation factor TFIIH subunit 1